MFIEMYSRCYGCPILIVFILLTLQAARASKPPARPVRVVRFDKYVDRVYTQVRIVASRNPDSDRESSIVNFLKVMKSVRLTGSIIKEFCILCRRENGCGASYVQVTVCVLPYCQGIILLPG